MYKFIAVLSLYIRTVYIPNPFEQLGEGINITINGVNVLFTPDMLEWMLEGLIYIFTFAVVGLIYNKNSLPTLGSLLYFVFYFVHIALIYGICNGSLSIVCLLVYLIGMCSLLMLSNDRTYML